MMHITDREIIVRALKDGHDDDLMLVPPEKTDNPDECIHYTENGFEHVSTTGTETVSKDDVREHANTWKIVAVNTE